MNSEVLKKVKKYGLSCAMCSVLEKMGLLKLKMSELYIQSYYLNLEMDKREEELKEWFESETGKTLNLDFPQRFNEKIQWLKLYDSTKIKTILADKYLVRKWVIEKIGEEYLIPMIGVWERFDDIDFEHFPSEYVLKGTHGSGMNIIVNKEHPLNIKEAKKKFDYWLKRYYGIGPMQEWHYREVPHLIMAEQYIGRGGVPADYKFYCFNGKPKYVQLIKGRDADARMAFYNVDWSDAGFTNLHFGKIETAEKKPKQLCKAIELATILSQGFSFVRVDLYFVGDENIYFGEMTFTPASGVSHWVPEEADEMLGKMIKLPQNEHMDEHEILN